MKTKLFNFILLGTLLMTGVVSAYTEPSADYPAGQVTPVVNVGSDQQVKSGAFWAKLIQAGSRVTKTSSLAGFLLAETFNIAPSGFMTHVILPGSDSQFRLGGGVSGALGNTIESGNESLFGYTFGNLKGDVKNILDSNRAPLTIDLLGRGVKETPASRDALAVISGGLCSQPTAIVTTASGVSFKSDYNKVLTDSNLKSDYADVLARQLRLKGGNPGKDKVLVAVDSLGNATWGTLKFEPVTKPNRPLYTAGCVLDPEYPKPGQQLCANTQNGQCATCSNATISECGKGIGYGHCKWDPQAIEIPGEGSVTTGMNVTVVYDKADSPVRASQMMCGLKDPVEPILGCTDPKYAAPGGNYNPNATQSNNDCKCTTGHTFNIEKGLCEKDKVIDINLTATIQEPELAGRCSMREVTKADLVFTSNGTPITEFESISFQVKLKNKIMSDYNQPGTLYTCLQSAGEPKLKPNTSDDPFAFNDFNFVPINDPLTKQIALTIDGPKLINAFKDNGSGKYYIEVAQNICNKPGAINYSCRPFDLTVRVNAVYKGKTYTKDIIIGKIKQVNQPPYNPKKNDWSRNIWTKEAQACFDKYPGDTSFTCAQLRNP